MLRISKKSENNMVKMRYDFMKSIDGYYITCSPNTVNYYW